MAAHLVFMWGTLSEECGKRKGKKEGKKEKKEGKNRGKKDL